MRDALLIESRTPIFSSTSREISAKPNQIISKTETRKHDSQLRPENDPRWLLKQSKNSHIQIAR